MAADAIDEDFSSEPMSSQTGNLTCHNQDTSEQVHEFDPGTAHVELSEKTHKIESEFSSDEQKVIGTLVASSVVDGKSNQVSDNITENSDVWPLGTPLCESGKNCQSGEGSYLQQHIIESVSGSLSNDKSEKICQPPSLDVQNDPVDSKPGESTFLQQCTVEPVSGNLSSDISEKICQPPSQDVQHEPVENELGEVLCLQKCTTELISDSLSSDKSEKICQPPCQDVQNETVENDPMEGSCLQQSTIEPVCGSLSNGQSEKICQPPLQDVQNEPVGKSDTAASFHAKDQMQSAPEQVNSGNEQLVPPSGDVVNNTSSECLDAKSKRATHIRLGRKDKKTPKSLKKKYMLRSLGGSDRALRSRSQEKPKAPEPNSSLVNADISRENKRRGRKKKKTRREEGMSDEFSRIRTRLRYLLNRVSYEQSLIDAYSGEGWKGYSLEKLKPEKELQRAKSEILRRKLKIRDLFRHLDTLCAEGRLPEALFDSEGEICSEDIFCAKCGSKDLTINNDIILCDGACDRGFHQFCLEPPLLTENIPPGDEGWLCPGCDCKDDCIDLLNDSLGTSLSLSDTWERVFPEAATTTGNNLDHNTGLPSDDSDDDDYNPDVPEDEEIRGGESKSDESESSTSESDYASASEELEASPFDELKASNYEDQYLGLPSDDSEDDDFDPNASDFERKDMEESSSSDFTSDSEDLTAAINVGHDQDNRSASLDDVRQSKGSGRQKCKVGKKQSLADELSSLVEPNPGLGGSSTVSGKRSIERLDYKKLYDETYHNVQCSSSDDEDWTESTAPSGRKRFTNNVASVSSDANQIQKDTTHTPRRNTRQNKVETTDNSPIKSSEGSRSSTYRRLDEAVVQRLYKSFKENQYPVRAAKESLAQELGLTLRQVSKWFENARWSFRHSSRMEASTGGNASEQATCSTSENGELLGGEEERKSELMSVEGSGQKRTTPSTRKRKHKSDSQASDVNLGNDSAATKPPDGSPRAQEVQTGKKRKTRKRK
ncbi:hypothetical protein L6164_035738 [Bauhinia variegata]|uniref:Uncharacterized protein n=1 Tax=Bauhinia variegata TaxID=167791 RepID=A0ACB9KEY6_BAUVA|nr:hypothetical protein L6164_035738 [Bauhinia variegata]